MTSCLHFVISRHKAFLLCRVTKLCVILFFSQGDYGQAHKFCGTDNHVPDFYTYGRTMFITFKSDAFMTGNGFSLTYQVAGKDGCWIYWICHGKK